MERYFFGQNKHLYGFGLDNDGNFLTGVRKIKSSSVLNLVQYSLNSNSEVHFMPRVKVPFLEIKEVDHIFYYVESEEEADELKGNIIVSGQTSCCQVI